MSGETNQGQARLMNFKEWVPDGARFWIYILFLVAFQFSNGFYFTAMSQVAGTESMTMNDVQMFGRTVLIGLTFYFPLAFRLKFRFTNLTSLTIAALGLAAVNAVFPYVHSYPLMLLLCYIGGFLRLYGTFECFSNLLPKIAPDYNYAVFLSFVFFVVLGCIHVFDWAAIQVIYHYDWQHVHLLAIALCLMVVLVSRITMRHFRPMPKMPLYGIDGLGMILWSIFILSAIFVVQYGEQYQWLAGERIRIGIAVSLISLGIVILRTNHISHPFIEWGAFRCPNLLNLMILFFGLDMLLGTQEVLQNTFTSGVLHYDQFTSAQLKWPEFIGAGVGALFFLFTRVKLKWHLKTLTSIAMSAVVLYCLLMTEIISPNINIGKMWLPLFFVGFGHVGVFIALTVYAQAYCKFKYYFQVLCLLGFMRTGIGGAIADSVWERALTGTMQQHLANIGSTVHISGGVSFDTMATIVSNEALLSSLRELYAWAVVFGVALLVIIMCSHFERLRNPLPKLKQAYTLLYRTIGNKALQVKQQIYSNNKQIMNRINTILILLLLGISTSYAQEHTYTLQELYTLADQNNKSIQVYELAKTVADKAALSAASEQLPDISTELSFNYNGRGFITDRDFSNYMSVYIPEYGNNFTLKVSQVIYAGGAIKSAVELGKLGQRMAELDSWRNTQDVRLMITGQYLDLCKAINTLSVLKQNIELTDKMIQNMRSRYEQGTAIKNDITRYELQSEMLRLQYAKAEDGYRILNRRLCLNTELPDSTLIRPDMNLLNATPESTNEGLWQQMAEEQNFGLKQASLAQEISAKELNIVQAASLPSVVLFAADNFVGPITTEVPVLNNNFNYWYVGVGLQFKISSIYKNNHNIQRATQQLMKSQKAFELAQEQISAEVQAAYVNYQTSFVEVKTQEKGIELANENYRTVSNRYENELALITDLLDAANTKLSAELNLTTARINLIYNYYLLKYLTHSL